MCYGEGCGKGRWVAGYSFETLGVARWYLSNISGCFGFRKLCADVTHPRPLSRGEVWNAVFLLLMSGLSGGVSPLERGLRGVLW